MNLDENAKAETADVEEEGQAAEGVESVEVEIQDAEGQVARMTLGPSSSGPRSGPNVLAEKT